MPRRGRKGGRELLAAPLMPSGIWFYLDRDEELVAECGRCEAWWFVEVDGPLDDEVQCRECELELYARGFGYRSAR